MSVQNINFDNGVASMQISGLKELADALNTIIPNKHFQKPVLQKALTAGAKIVVIAAIARVPKRTGQLAKAIYSYADKRASSDTIQYRNVGVKGGKNKTKKIDAYYWRYIEFGRKTVTAKGGTRSLGTPGGGFFGKTVAAYPAHPFLRPAFESTKEQVIAAMTDVLREELVQAGEAARWYNVRR